MNLSRGLNPPKTGFHFAPKIEIEKFFAEIDLTINEVSLIQFNSTACPAFITGLSTKDETSETTVRNFYFDFPRSPQLEASH